MWESGQSGAEAKHPRSVQTEPGAGECHGEDWGLWYNAALGDFGQIT